ncbi:hypothetical protein PAPHI01_0505 [Pancytospora philotis]|nr:hypothetical protein PAPHI01_0505 [Pancytospora philotis]
MAAGYLMVLCRFLLMTWFFLRQLRFTAVRNGLRRLTAWRERLEHEADAQERARRIREVEDVEKLTAALTKYLTTDVCLCLLDMRSNLSGLRKLISGIMKRFALLTHQSNSAVETALKIRCSDVLNKLEFVARVGTASNGLLQEAEIGRIIAGLRKLDVKSCAAQALRDGNANMEALTDIEHSLQKAYTKLSKNNRRIREIKSKYAHAKFIGLAEETVSNAMRDIDAYADTISSGILACIKIDFLSKFKANSHGFDSARYGSRLEATWARLKKLCKDARMAVKNNKCAIRDIVSKMEGEQATNRNFQQMLVRLVHRTSCAEIEQSLRETHNYACQIARYYTTELLLSDTRLSCYIENCFVFNEGTPATAFYELKGGGNERRCIITKAEKSGCMGNDRVDRVSLLSEAFDFCYRDYHGIHGEWYTCFIDPNLCDENLLRHRRIGSKETVIPCWYHAVAKLGWLYVYVTHVEELIVASIMRFFQRYYSSK